MYIQIEYKNNKFLVRCIDRLTIKTVHVINERSNYITYISYSIISSSLHGEYVVNYITK